MARYLRVRLSNGDVRHLDTFKWDAEGGLSKFLDDGDVDFGEGHLPTVEKSDVLRSAIVEVYIVELKAELRHPDPEFREWGDHDSEPEPDPRTERAKERLRRRDERERGNLVDT